MAMTELEQHYNKFNEEKRLDSRHGRVEFITSMKYIHNCLDDIKAAMDIASDIKILDIGAGTGSVTVELALHALYGTVYAVERTEEGCSLIAKNAEKFGLNNIEIIHGNAAAVIDSLPVPDKVFIGGSGGELEYIFSSILKKNPYVHIVVTAVTLETLNNTISLMEKNGVNVLDIVQIAVTEVKKRGRYHMMSANNPVFIIEGIITLI